MNGSDHGISEVLAWHLHGWMDGGKLSKLHLRLLTLQLRFDPYAFQRKE